MPTTLRKSAHLCAFLTCFCKAFSKEPGRDTGGRRFSFTVPIKRSLDWARAKGSAISKMATAVEVIRKLATGWLKWLPIVGYYFGLLDQVAKDKSIKLTEKKEEAIRKGCFIDAVLIAFEQKLSAYDIETTYLHR